MNNKNAEKKEEEEEYLTKVPEEKLKHLGILLYRYNQNQ